MSQLQNNLGLLSMFILGSVAGTAQPEVTPQWKLLNSPLPDIHYGNVDFVNKNVGFITGYKGILLKTTDGGISWSNKSFTDKEILAIDIFDAQAGYLSVDSLGIYKTTDGADEWENLSLA